MRVNDWARVEGDFCRALALSLVALPNSNVSRILCGVFTKVLLVLFTGVIVSTAVVLSGFLFALV